MDCWPQSGFQFCSAARACPAVGGGTFRGESEKTFNDVQAVSEMTRWIQKAGTTRASPGASSHTHGGASPAASGCTRRSGASIRTIDLRARACASGSAEAGFDRATSGRVGGQREYQDGQSVRPARVSGRPECQAGQSARLARVAGSGRATAQRVSEHRALAPHRNAAGSVHWEARSGTSSGHGAGRIRCQRHRSAPASRNPHLLPKPAPKARFHHVRSLPSVTASWGPFL